MYIAAIMDLFKEWFSRENIPSTLGYGIAIVCGIFILTELYSIIVQKNEPDLMMMLLAGLIGGLIQGLTKDPLLAILAALCCIMIFSLWTIRQSPVWRELMFASLVSYVLVLGGRTIQRIMEIWVAYKGYDIATYTRWGLTGQQWFGISWNIFIYVFIFLCLIFFGRRFFIVSRLTSPQVIYLFLFALSYFILYRFTGEDGLNFYFEGVPTDVADRVLFASFGTYEIMILTNFALYLVSGPLLHLIFGVKKVKDERVLGIIEEVKGKLGIKGKVRVGRVKAPILNAFAYGAFFDKRIVFMSKELDDLSDDDIRGIAGHELVHAKKIHTFYLFLITALTFAITKAIKFPATPLDYIFDPDVGLEFLWYYLYNLALVGFSYIFIRYLEGQADKFTMRAGYGKPLAKSLIKLDGFYQGIASEMGLSVYLLTNKEQTPAEKLRFLGDSGRNMYRNYIKPSISENFINLIASHPKTAYRVMALTEQKKLPPFKAAILPFLLVLPFVRKKFVRELQEMRTNVSPVIDETFNDFYPKNGVKNYDKLAHLSYLHRNLQGKDIVAISHTNKKEFIQGNVSKIEITESITSPVVLTLKTKNGNQEVTISEYDLFELAEGQTQVFKNGSIGTIIEIGTNSKKFAFKAKVIQKDKEIVKEFTLPGVPKSYFESIVGKPILFAFKGITRLATLDKIDFSKKHFSNSKFSITMDGKTEVLTGDSFIVSFKPFDVYLKKNNREKQQSLIDYLKDKPASFQTKDDLDVLIKGNVTKVEEDTLHITTLDETKNININRIEFLYLYEDTIALLYKSSLSFIEKILIKLQNSSKLSYIYP